MKALVIGSGGREHALCWKLRQSPLLTELFCAPGNPGIAAVADRVPFGPEEIHELAGFAEELGVDLTVVGPELPLTLGLVDEFERRGLPVFGPRKAAAELEGSKIFAKEFMARHGIPTAEFALARDRAEAERAVAALGLPVVLKADGLAAGKGVVIVRSASELEPALALFFDERRFGVAGDRIVVERCLEGEEVSFLALVDGERLLPFATARDYKRLLEGDEGPNTGGMGAHSPSGLLTSAQAAEVLEKVMRPTVAGMAEENRLFRGVLYAGLMITAEGPRVLEFNARFGDPETQALLLRMEDDLLPLLADGAAGAFQATRLHFRKEAAAVVVLASRGYPEKAVKGEPITGLEEAAAIPGAVVLHAGTELVDGSVVAAGGRVINVGATGPDLATALRTAYAAVARVDWPSKIYRADIGRAFVERSFPTLETGSFNIKDLKLDVPPPPDGDDTDH
ncbi:MAG: phosphoribosylamine--glycine ligase [Thermoanaerobaculia bacterium]|nr:MAG: phosphoribosylamine--glycine ligase [Thermoanaerobaculia bacterium]